MAITTKFPVKTARLMPRLHPNTRSQGDSQRQVMQAILTAVYPWLLLLATVCLTWWLARAFWLVVAPPKPPALTPLPLQPATLTQTTPNNALDIFAAPQAMPIQAVLPADIKVLGVTQAIPTALSYAIISQGGKAKSYRIGEALEGTPFKLMAVGKDHIMLADGSGQSNKVAFGQPFSLDQSDSIRAKSPLTAQNNTLTNANNQAPNTLNNPANSANAAMMSNGTLPNGTGIQLPSPSQSPTMGNTSPMNAPVAANPNNAQTNNPNSNVTQNPTAYLGQMGVAATGQGYVVTDSMPEQLRNRMGLQIGDKVLSVNGQLVGQNPAQDAQLMKQVQQSGQAQIQIQRGDQTVTVRQSF